MDECITCKCGFSDWTIGTSGIRCSECGYLLDYIINIDITEMNKKIKNDE